MNFFPSWKALFGKLAADQPDLADFRGRGALLQRGQSVGNCVAHLASAPETAALALSGDNKAAKILHHFHLDVESRSCAASGHRKNLGAAWQRRRRHSRRSAG